MHSGKQVFTGFVTLLALMVGYFLYSETVGRFTDFPEATLEDLTPMVDDIADYELGDELVREANIAAIRAFGPGCPEQDASMKWESRPRNLDESVAGRGLGLYMYIHQYKILDNPRFVELTPFSLVYIHKTGDGHASTDAIETVRGAKAVIEFQDPIDVTKLTQPKPIGGWVRGDVELKTNRRTADDATDDIVVFTDKLDYSASRNLIWADDWIRLFSSDIKVTGTGMELGLYPESQAKLKLGTKTLAGAAPAEEEPEENKGDFKYVRLQKNVRFDLQLDNSDDLFGASKPGDAPAEQGSKKSQERVPVTITSRGPFHFDAETNVGAFEKAVQMLRRNQPKTPEEQETIDSIDSDRLVLQFKQDEKKSEETAGKGAQSKQLVLAAATATGREVLLFSDSQHLQATGNYLFYDAEKRQATLRGEKEMIAFHDNTIIHARSLNIDQGGEQGIQQLTADGPNGWLEMLGKDGEDGKQGSQLKIRWQGRLQTSGRDGDTQHVVITGNVELEDRQTALKCDQLQVWLVPVETTVEPTDQAEADGQPKKKTRWEPVKIEAQNNVSASSPELSIVTQVLTMDILRMEAQPQPEKPVQVAAAAEVEPPKTDAPPATKEKPPADQPVAATKEPEPKQPLAVRAERVAVVLQRQGSESKPVSAWAEGDVFVSQPPQNKDEEPLKISGQSLDYARKTDGDVIQVRGSNRKIAVIETKDMVLAGNQVMLDELVNRVEASGAGYLIRMTSNDLTGESRPSSSEPQLLRIDWTQKMVFDGKLGTFHGDVKAQQGTKEVHCQTMDVCFDQRIEFREARLNRERRSQGQLKIETVDCDRNVVVHDLEKENGEFIRRTTLYAQDLRYDNQFQSMSATGPGLIRIVERNKPKTDAKGNTVPPEMPFTLTEVHYGGAMNGNQQNKTATFYQNVNIVHLPVADHNAAYREEQNLPDDGVIIDADDTAMMGERKLASGVAEREFKADGNVRVRARKFTAQCDRLSYDQSKDLLVFDAKPGRKATFYRQEVVGQEPQIFRGAPVKYKTKSGDLQVINSDGLNNLEIVPKNK